MSNRAELFKNAVAFLADPTTRGSPLAQRVQFLESKGLTSSEIDDAIRQAARTTPSSNAPDPVPPGYSTYAPSVYGLSTQNPRPQRDWRDYFVIAVISGSLMYGAMALARRYILPHLQPPSQTQYEADSAALTVQFDEVEAKLHEMKLDCEAARSAAESQRDRVNGLVTEVQSTLAGMKDAEARNRDDLREIRDEVDIIREMIPKMLEKNKEGANAALLDLQQELKSLKTLLLNSPSRGLSNGSTSPGLPSLVGRPSIPAWQLAMPLSASVSSSTPAPVQGQESNKTAEGNSA